MSTFSIPLSLSRRGRCLLYAALTLVDDTGEVYPTGSPPRAVTSLATLCGVSRTRIYEALNDLRGLGLASSSLVDGHHDVGRAPIKVRIHLDKLQPSDGCAICGSLARGTGKWCARCKQVEGRDDREWQVRAQEMAVAGVSPVRIASRLGRPLFASSLVDDGRDPAGGAVVPMLLAKGLIGNEWQRFTSSRNKGETDD